jgi:hypothetical protein
MYPEHMVEKLYGVTPVPALELPQLPRREHRDDPVPVLRLQAQRTVYHLGMMGDARK